MKCKVCGKNSGSYTLCFECNKKKVSGEIIKCEKCGEWHYVNEECKILTEPLVEQLESSETVEISNNTDETLAETPSPIEETPKENKTFIDNYDYIDKTFLYSKRKCMLTNNEWQYFMAIRKVLPNEFFIHIQANLATFIEKNINNGYRNELYRNVDFLVTDYSYTPLFVIEINDRTHLDKNRKDRDEKVRKILEEAGVPVVKLWTSYGINEDYIAKRLHETLMSLPVTRIHHFDLNKTKQNFKQNQPNYHRVAPNNTTYSSNRNYQKSSKAGCYIATSVYGSYDTSEVWVLRRFRDFVLNKNIFGRFFIKIYYALSPKVVEIYGENTIFNKISRKILDKFVARLKIKGFSDKPYSD